MQESEDVEFEQEDESPADTLKKLRERLAKCTDEKQSYLDGWQRAKADFVNTKRELESRIVSAREVGKDELARELGPIFDALDAAAAAGSGSGGPLEEGVRNIASQLMGVLKRSGIELYGTPGDPLDHRFHEPIGSEAPPDPGKDHTIAKVHQRGLRRGDHIIRPATVTIYQSEEKS